MTKIVPLVVEDHADLKVKSSLGFSHLKDQHILPLVAHEFVSVSSDVPVIFIKHAESGRIMPMALLGLKPGENLVVDEAGVWTNQYIPGIVATYPFRVMPSPHDQSQLAIAIDEESDWVSKDEGNALFEDGQETDFLVNRKNAVQTYFEHNQITEGFVSILSDLDLFDERTLTIEASGDQINLNGIYAVNEEKLNALPEDKFNDLRKRGFLPAIYAHMISLNQIRRLGLKHSQRRESEA